ncbi:SMC-Scp complex subunit ScpB [Thalassoroseus pseudoceratinae]|uniref:SMC-Scp complex subunit ScpB n=1 Tax=Thalassoroseus pseudoceratinae TaxID=2713176 RepID=UPI001422797B|nr:SMC-Scp complex subunit ScpB [Thalassoroseus pseudoceratinae]
MFDYPTHAAPWHRSGDWSQRHRVDDACTHWLGTATKSPTKQRPEPGAGDGVRSEKLGRLEAALFVADGALSVRRLTQVATLADAAEAKRLLDELNELYDTSGSSFRIERVASGFQLLTRPAYSNWLRRVHERQSELKLSPPAMETLTIIAYRQPVTRADVEAVRGVQSAEMIKQLMERGLVRICGEEDTLGRPYLYDTTRQFLEVFGLRSLDDLPMADRLRRKKEEPPPPTEETSEDGESAENTEEPQGEHSDGEDAPGEESSDEAEPVVAEESQSE